MRGNEHQVFPVSDPADGIPAHHGIGTQAVEVLVDAIPMTREIQLRAGLPYRSVKGPDDTVRLEIEPAEAAIVRRIFELYVNGKSLRQIAWEFNAEGVPSPRPQKGRISGSWCTSSVRVILRTAERLGTFTLYSGKEAGEWAYTAKGSVGWFGETNLRVGGAGGQTCTILPQAMFFVDLAA